MEVFQRLSFNPCVAAPYVPFVHIDSDIDKHTSLIININGGMKCMFMGLLSSIEGDENTGCEYPFLMYLIFIL